LRDTLSCGSWLVYATRADAPDAARIRNLVLFVKRDQIHLESRRLYVSLLVERMNEALGSVGQLFRANTLLVPIPRAGLTRPNTVWPALSICRALHSTGLGGSVATILARTRAVHKSAGSQSRPSLQDHHESLTVQGSLDRLEQIVLVDDVVTSGTTLMAGAQRLREVFPRASIQAFALARVHSTGKPSRLVEPVVERISVVGQRCRREMTLTP
jgi:hypothetical protein